MLKFVDKNGKIKFIQFDEKSEPVEVEKISVELLRRYGVVEELSDEDIERIKLHGLSQDDLKMIRG